MYAFWGACNCQPDYHEPEPLLATNPETTAGVPGTGQRGRCATGLLSGGACLGGCLGKKGQLAGRPGPKPGY